MAEFQKEPKCVMEDSVTPRNKIHMGYIECTLAAHCRPEQPREYLNEWLQWMDTIYEQVDAEIASLKEFHEAWAHDRRAFRRMVRAACNARYLEINAEKEEVWPLLSRLNVHRPYQEGSPFLPIENRIIQDWSRIYG